MTQLTIDEVCHAETSDAGLALLHRRILDVLAHHRGRAAALPMPALALRIGITTRAVQGAIHELIDLGEPIGSATGTPAGYFLLTTRQEFTAAIEQLEHRIGSLSKRCASLRRLAVTAVDGQLRMPLPLLPRERRR